MNQALRSAQREAPISGFALIELAVVVTIIGILAALALPYFKRATQNTLISRLENDLRIYEQTFETYELEFGTMPPSQPTAGLFPIGLEDRLSHKWKYDSPIGGVYRWIYDENSLDDYAYIEILNSADKPITIALSRLIEIDNDLDDGDTTTGKIRFQGLNIQYYVRR
ncbi:MAG TPA: hypothetical protein DCX06_01885 [Opitutae bacterium]|nr:hypothetical protein [Opitutae bacterium]